MNQFPFGTAHMEAVLRPMLKSELTRVSRTHSIADCYWEASAENGEIVTARIPSEAWQTLTDRCQCDLIPAGRATKAVLYMLMLVHMMSVKVINGDYEDQ